MKILYFIMMLSSISCTRTVFDRPENDNFSSSSNFSKIAVFAVSDKSATYRTWENEITAALKAQNIVAEAGYVFFDSPRSTINPMKAADSLRKKGFDSAVLVQLVAMKNHSISRKNSDPEFQEAEVMGHFATHFSRASGSGTTAPSKPSQKTIVVLETSLYSLKKDFPLVWAAKSNTFNPYDEASTRKSYAKALAKILKASNHFN